MECDVLPDLPIQINDPRRIFFSGYKKKTGLSEVPYSYTDGFTHYPDKTKTGSRIEIYLPFARAEMAEKTSDLGVLIYYQAVGGEMLCQGQKLNLMALLPENWRLYQLRSAQGTYLAPEQILSLANKVPSIDFGMKEIQIGPFVQDKRVHSWDNILILLWNILLAKYTEEIGEPGNKQENIQRYTKVLEARKGLLQILLHEKSKDVDINQWAQEVFLK